MTGSQRELRHHAVAKPNLIQADQSVFVILCLLLHRIVYSFIHHEFEQFRKKTLCAILLRTRLLIVTDKERENDLYADKSTQQPNSAEKR